jgi:hypothetical protein
VLKKIADARAVRPKVPGAPTTTAEGSSGAASAPRKTSADAFSGQKDSLVGIKSEDHVLFSQSDASDVTGPPPVPRTNSVLSNSSSVASSSFWKAVIPKRQPFLPMSTYHTEVTSNKIGLRRFAWNAPAVFVFWASWDLDSMAFLQRAVFPHMGGDSGVEKPSVATPDDDVWLHFCCRYVDFRSFHATMAEDLQAASAAAEAAAKAKGGDSVIDQSASKLLQNARDVRLGLPQVYRSFVAFGDAEAEASEPTEKHPAKDTAKPGDDAAGTASSTLPKNRRASPVRQSPAREGPRRVRVERAPWKRKRANRVESQFSRSRPPSKRRPMPTPERS